MTAHPESDCQVAAALVVILVVAKLAGHVAARLGQPAVLGELMAACCSATCRSSASPVSTPVKTDPHVDMLARLGVLILLFEVGLESTVAQMCRSGCRRSSSPCSA